MINPAEKNPKLRVKCKQRNRAKIYSTQERKARDMTKKDSAFVLFGKTISFPTQSGDLVEFPTTSTSENKRNDVGGEVLRSNQEDDYPSGEPSTKPAKTSADDPINPDVDKNSSSTRNHKENEKEKIASQEKTLKKPDKVLPCPRCNSMNTKFCYFNNYNVHQPRYFCKSCQRYWTDGGTMRNVPIGSGRRKTRRSSALNYRHVMIRDALQAAQARAINEMYFPTSKFGSDRALHGSMASALNIKEKSKNHSENDLYGKGKRVSQSFGGREIGIADPQCFPVPWSTTKYPASGYSGFPVKFSSTALYSSCRNLPWISPLSPHLDQTAVTTSPTLGKHSRRGDSLGQPNPRKEDISEDGEAEKCISIPKTLRIGDPDEVAKSSIRSTLQIKDEKTDSINSTTLFNSFHSKGDSSSNPDEISLVLQANPAALFRSLNFHENS